MPHTHVAMILSNAFRPDPRVLKEARSLVRAGYQVTVICWDRTGELPQTEECEGITIRRIRTVRSGYSAGSKQVLYLPQFWLSVLHELRSIRPQVIHSHDLDTTPVGAWYSRMNDIPWIFDAHECYPEQIGPQVNPNIYRFLIYLEKLMTRNATHLITVGQLLATRFEQMGAKIVTVVGNYQELGDFEKLDESVGKTIQVPIDDMLISYIGGFTPARAIIPMMQATSLIKGVTFLLGGDGPQRSEIESLLDKCPKVHYLGWVDAAMIPYYVQSSDALYYGLYAANGNSRFSTPNSLFNAMAAGKPILTTKLGEIAQIVNQEKCGMVLDELTPQQLATSLLSLRNNKIRCEYAENARRAGIEKYNWQIAEKALLNVYKSVL